MGLIADLFGREDACTLLVNLDGRIAEKYNWYKEFLVQNREALNIISELELLQEDSQGFALSAVERRYDRLFEATEKLVQALDALSGGRHKGLVRICGEVDEAIRPLFEVSPGRISGDLVLPFEDLTEDMTSVAGSKATNLAVIGNVLGLPVPAGFVVTAEAFRLFLERNDLNGPIDEMLGALTPEGGESLDPVAASIQEKILRAGLPPELEKALYQAYEALEGKTREGVRVAMRSTAVGEDTEASFAGQYKTVLNVGRAQMVEAYKTVLASKYSPRAIRYRMRSGLDDHATPMCVAAVTMIGARASGVVYSADPSGSTREGPSEVMVTATWGLGELLVSGESSPDTFYVDRETGEITRRAISPKPYRMVAAEGGGTRLEELTGRDREEPSLDDASVRALAQWGLQLERHFGAPQDMEWCRDPNGRLFILQSRPLGITQSRPQEMSGADAFEGHAVLFSGGSRASGGAASGRVLHASGIKGGSVPRDAILVAKAASPEYARFVGSLRGIITDLGSVASHLASVAREFGVPMVVQAGDATGVLKEGEEVTLVADSATVYKGVVAGLEAPVSPPGEGVFQSPVRRKMNEIMARVSPLNLTDPKSASFSPENCETIHDIIRYSHETVVKEMFGLSQEAGEEGVRSVRMTANIPVALYFVDLGAGLEKSLTTCDDITPDAIASPPMKALWRGLSHPGISWSGAVGLSARNVMALMTSGSPPQMASYVVLSDEYVNLSFKFGYHYANLDIFHSDEPDNNYISLQFGGGAGSWFGRSMRIHFLSEVLEQLGFTLNISGDLLEAVLKGYDRDSMEEALDQVGRLLAVTRLLDLAIQGRDQVEPMVKAFLAGDYNLLGDSRAALEGFYTLVGEWRAGERGGRQGWLQEGSGSGEGLSCTFKNIMGKMAGDRYQRFLDSIQAYHYFPLAVLKESHVTNATVEATLSLEGGCIDRTGGLVFGFRNFNHYFVFALDALAGSAVVFEFVKGKRVSRTEAKREVESGRGYRLSVRVQASSVECSVDGEPVLIFEARKPVEGYVGLWTKADSRVYFEDLVVKETSAAAVKTRETAG